MASRSKIRASIKALANKRPGADKLHESVVSLINQSDLSAALVGASLLEHALQMALISCFVPLDRDEQARLFDSNGNGALTDFAAKIAIGYALGIYGKDARDDLNIIKTIRNLFAHATEELKFDTKEITDALSLFNSKFDSDFQ